MRFGGGTSAVEEGVFLNWRGTVQFMFWKVCGRKLKRCGLNYG